MNRGHSPLATFTRAFRRIPDFALLLVEVVALVAVVAASAVAWKNWPAVPLADLDTWGYLNPSLSWLDGLGFQQTDGRDWLYPALLALFLKTTGSFGGIVLWQRALSVLSGALMGITWRCWVSMLPLNRWLRFSISLLGLLPIGLQLTSPQSMAYVMGLRPEAVLVCFVYAQLACLVGYCKYRWHTPRELPSLLLGVGALFFAYACFVLKPSWLGASLATSLPVLVGCLGNAISLKTRLSAVSLGILVALLALWMPARKLLIRDAESVTLLPDALFCVHAPLIVNCFEARLATLPVSDPDKAKLSALLGVVKSELNASKHVRGVYEKLGFDPDYLMHNATLTAAIRDYTGDDDQRFSAFCIRSYRDAVAYDPVAYARKVIIQSTYFFFPKPKDFWVDKLDLAKAYKASPESIDPECQSRFHGRVRQMFAQYLADETAVAGPELTLGKKLGKRHFMGLAASILPVEIVFFAALLGAILWPPLSPLRVSGLAALMLFLAPLSNAMTVCMVHALDIDRYRFTYSGFLMFALAAMAIYMVAVFTGIIRYFAAAFANRCRDDRREPKEAR